MTGVEQVVGAHQRLLFVIAYGSLGSVAEAEDVVQEALLRWTQAAAGIEPPRG